MFIPDFPESYSMTEKLLLMILCFSSCSLVSCCFYILLLLAQADKLNKSMAKLFRAGPCFWSVLL